MTSAPGLFSLILPAAGFVFVLMSALWLRQLFTRNAGIVDLGWTTGIVFTALLYFSSGGGWAPRSWTLYALVLIWGLRLGGYLTLRLLRDSNEDPRYREIREKLGAGAALKFFWIFQFQALSILILSVPFLLTARNARAGFSGFEIAGIVLWLVGFLGESLADFQLSRFKGASENKGKPCTSGLWRYSRHPNYFFEWLMWAAYFVYACASPHGWYSVSAPLLMLYFLTCVSGIPPAEMQALRTKGEAYMKYQKVTSPFIPWFPKKNPHPCCAPPVLPL